VKSRHNVDWWLAAILTLAAGLLLFDLGGRSLWWDEIINVYIERQPVALIFSSLSNAPGLYQDIHPPLYHLMMHYWVGLAGTSDLAMRLPSATFGLLSVGLVYAVGRQSGGLKLARVAAFLTAIAPGGLMYLRMGRYYAFTCALGLLTTWLFLKLWTTPRRWPWFAYGLVALAMYYTDYMVVTVLAVHTLFALWQGWRSCRRVALRLLGLQILVALAYLPWLLFVAAQVGWAGQLIPADLAFSPIGYALKVALPFISFTAGETLFPWEIPALVDYLVFGALLVLGVIRGQIASVYRSLFLSLFLIPVLATIGVISFIMPTLPFVGVANRALFALPYFNLVAGCGLLVLKKCWKQAAALALVTLVAAWGIVNYFRGAHFFNPIYAVPAEEVVDFVLANSRPSDVVFSTEDIGFAYYLTAKGGDLPHYWSYTAEADRILEQATAPRIWWLTFGRDRTRRDEAVQQYRDQLAASGYELVLQQGFVPQDPTYRRVKERLLGREAYEYKVVVSLYALEGP
jgi:4-amino-4-deoxy-L-arabinose transferase-like glycosyltransferase